MWGISWIFKVERGDKNGKMEDGDTNIGSRGRKQKKENRRYRGVKETGKTAANNIIRYTK